ncbi:hypothetical protein DRI50_08210 [candidate division KSB1 bacterium]|jgi:hypothetical protein|nr:MAG: hypothetical protein DRI50_08210 [candidate division KSB1 bacterium]
MKNLFFNSLAIALLIFSVASAQNTNRKKAPSYRLGIYGNVIVAQAEFASTNGSKAGFANNGVGAMFEFVRYTKFPFNWISSVSFASQSFKAGALQDQTPEYGITADNYITTWLMTGLAHEKSFGPELSIYGLGQIGLLLSKYPDIFYATNNLDEYKQTTSMGKALAFAAGIGIKYNLLNLGVRYYAAFPEYKQKSPFTNGSSVKRNLPAKILQVVFGINF